MNVFPLRKMLRRLRLAVLLPVLAGCASQSELTAIRLDPDHPQYRTSGCQHSLQNAEFHRDVKSVSQLASPLLVIVSGGLLLPVVAANAGLDYVDRVDASNMATRCGGKGQSEEEIVRDVSTGAAFGVVTGGKK